MPVITIISTVHNEMGNCTSTELCKIIESIAPEIIFEELSENAYNRCYVLNNLPTLESKAIKLYLKHFNIKHIPVVNTELDIESKYSFLIKHESYRSLLDELFSLEMEYGLKFLNSISSVKMFDKIMIEEQSILNELNDEILFKINQRCKRDIDIYELDILNNIYDYSQLNDYSNAVLLLGAAHRKSLMEKISSFQVEQPLNINWRLFNAP